MLALGVFSVGLMSACIGAAPIGCVHFGLLANWLGAPTAVTIMALEGVIVLFVVYRKWLLLNERQPHPDEAVAR